MRFILEGLTENSTRFQEIYVLVRRQSLSKNIKLAIKNRSLKPHPRIDFDSLFDDIGPGADRIKKTRYHHRKLKETVEGLGINVMLPTTEPLGKDFPIPWAGLIYDFQHKYYPNFFSAEELMWRDAAFERMLRDAPLVIVNSKSVKSDIVKFFPHFSNKAINLPFAPLLRPAWLKYDPGAARSKYGINEKYFIICNQFWIHKDHETAFKATRLLLDSQASADVDLVCTGALEDYRSPEHMQRLRRLLDDLNLNKRVKILGRIPKEDQIALLRGARAVVQPTLFEGDPAAGSGYEAMALGVPLIASDIPVNLEIEGESNVYFFEARNPHQLSQHMLNLLDHSIKISDEELIYKSKFRRSALCKSLHNAAELARLRFEVAG